MTERHGLLVVDYPVSGDKVPICFTKNKGNALTLALDSTKENGCVGKSMERDGRFHSVV
jgi:hypothetical protein